jgi:hypothetical protein
MELGEQMKRRLLVFLVSGALLSFPPSAIASAGPAGEPCFTLNKVEIYGNYKYTCIKAPRSISNPLQKKLVWSKGVALPKPKSLESSRNSTDRLIALNALGLGKWRQVDNEGFNAQVFISTWPCRIYMANDLNSAVEIYNDKVNINFYGGFWLGIQSQKWVVDQPSTSDRACVQYFSRKYGGRIYNGNTQSWDNY